MALVKWDPFRALTDLHRNVDRLFGDRFPAFTDEGLYGTGWNPSVDVYETESEVVVEAELPGVSEKDLSVEVRDNVLTISGERKREQEEKGDHYHRVERSYGKFQRSFTLPDSIEAEKVSAKTQSGVLTVRLPKAPKAVAKKIAIKAG